MAWPWDQPNKLSKVTIQLLSDFTSHNTVWEIDEERGGTWEQNTTYTANSLYHSWYLKFKVKFSHVN